jgi:Mor family transcriptional regulator
VDNKSKWERNIDALRRFVAENGHAKVPSTYTVNVDSEQIGLGTWVAYMRTKYRKNALSSEKVSQLESLQGWVWNPGKPGPAGNPKRDEEIIKARLAGEHLQQIADKFNLSRQRVHQIIERSKTVRV